MNNQTVMISSLCSSRAYYRGSSKKRKDTTHTTHNTQHTTHDTQHTTHNTQHTTHNTQRAYRGSSRKRKDHSAKTKVQNDTAIILRCTTSIRREIERTPFR